MEKFSYEEYGYNREEVNNFIEEVIENTQDIINSCLEQRKEIEINAFSYWSLIVFAIYDEEEIEKFNKNSKI